MELLNLVTYSNQVNGGKYRFTKKSSMSTKKKFLTRQNSWCRVRTLLTPLIIISSKDPGIRAPQKSHIFEKWDLFFSFLKGKMGHLRLKVNQQAPMESNAPIDSLNTKKYSTILTKDRRPVHLGMKANDFQILAILEELLHQNKKCCVIQSATTAPTNCKGNKKYWVVLFSLSKDSRQ